MGSQLYDWRVGRRGLLAAPGERLGSDMLLGFGAFDSATGWAITAPSYVASGLAHLISTDGSYKYFSKGISVEAGKRYRIDIDILAVAAGSLRVQGTGGGLTSYTFPTSPGSYSTILTALGTGTASFYLDRAGGVTDITFDNVLIREILGSGPGPNLAVNGTFSADTDWAGTGGSWTISGGLLNASAAFGSVTQDLGVIEAGKSYLVSYDMVRTAGGVKIELGGTVGAIRSATGSYAEVIVAGAASPDIRINNHGGYTGTVDNLVIREVL